ncbi:MAG: ATP-binding protein [Eubacterium sp.]|nr:ATP-binding protein [Eubacterium sp.]
MYRKFYEILMQWEKEHSQEPMMVIGARQVGKTWLIRKFCKDVYKDYIYINLEEQRDIASIFEGNLDPTSILRQIGQLLGRRIDEKTPVFFDEIQVSERAVTSLKYFCESEKNYRIICAGSLLGVKLKRFKSSFPVGKVKIVKMYPMDFEEFLLACDEELLRDGILDAFQSKKPLAEGIHQKANHLYQDYLYTGGMPQAVMSYLEHDKTAFDVDALLYDNLRLAYLADMTKYVTSPAEGVKITEVYRSIPRQLARENPKFKYNEVRPRANKRDFQGPLDWLDASGMVYRVHRLDAPLPPLRGYENADSFKIYLSDTGLLAHMCGLHYSDLMPDHHNIYKGAVTENFVVQQLRAKNFELYYFKPSENMEIDLVLDLNEQIIPVEIKSGRHKRSTSLTNYREKYHPAYAIRFSELNFGWENGLYSIPLYAVWCIA